MAKIASFLASILKFDHVYVFWFSQMFTVNSSFSSLDVEIHTLHLVTIYTAMYMSP